MRVKPQALTFGLFIATLAAIGSSSMFMARWPNRFGWVTLGLGLFVVLMIVVALLATRRTA